MKVISFSAVEILPALLDRSKTQTLRPAWKEDAYLRCNDISKEINPNKYFKEPRFKVGEKVKLMWKCRSPYKYFSPDDGRGVLKLKDGATWVYEPMIKVSNLFEKTLGTGTITEVFEIEMAGHWFDNYPEDGPPSELSFNPCRVDTEYCPDRNELAELDGFGDYVDMFEYFDKAYGLDSPKRFYVYRWRWDE